jgi:hypothetical protein
LYRRLGGPQSQTGHYGEEKYLFPLLGIDPLFLGHPVFSLVSILTELSHLLENRVLTRISGLRRQEVTGRWEKNNEY